MHLWYMFLPYMHERSNSANYINVFYLLIFYLFGKKRLTIVILLFQSNVLNSHRSKTVFISLVDVIEACAIEKNKIITMTSESVKN